jgi:hypothetical protein
MGGRYDRHPLETDKAAADLRPRSASTGSAVVKLTLKVTHGRPMAPAAPERRPSPIFELRFSRGTRNTGCQRNEPEIEQHWLLTDPMGFRHDTDFAASGVDNAELASDPADSSICARSRGLQRDADDRAAFDRGRSIRLVGAAARCRSSQWRVLA